MPKGKKDPLDGNEGQKRSNEFFVKCGGISASVKKARFFIPPNEKFKFPRIINLGEDLLASDGIAYVPIANGIPAGVYHWNSTSYNHGSDHKDAYDKIIPFDVSSWVNLTVITFFRFPVGKTSRIKMQVSIRKDPGNWIKIYDEMKGMFKNTDTLNV